MAIGVTTMTLPASARPVVNGIPPVGVHGIIIHRCHPWDRRCCLRWHRHCGPLGIVGRPIGRHPIGIIGTRPIGVRPIGVQTHGIGPVGPAHGGFVNGIPVQQQVQH